MKKASLILFAMAMFFVAKVSYADDFYVPQGEGPYYNPYNGMWVVNLPPPPPMNQVPWYVRDDYDDYLEDYYGCILGYEDWSFECRYWRKYAEKNNLYTATNPNQNATNNNIKQPSIPQTPNQ